MKVCSVEGCERPHSGRGYCIHHYRQWKGAKVCLVEGCERRARRRGCCNHHYQLAPKQDTGRPCSICALDNRLQIDLALFRRVPTVTIAGMWGVHVLRLHRHRCQCLGFRVGKRPCSICLHPDREAIEVAFGARGFRGETGITAIAATFGVSKDQIHNHMTLDHLEHAALLDLAMVAAIRAYAGQTERNR